MLPSSATWVIVMKAKQFIGLVRTVILRLSLGLTPTRALVKAQTTAHPPPVADYQDWGGKWVVLTKFPGETDAAAPGAPL